MDYKYVGFDLTENKQKIFDILLQSIADFTIPNSRCNVFYKNRSGVILGKIFNKP